MLVHIFFVCVSTGAASDFQQATKIATAMVKRFGMSEKVSIVLFIQLFFVLYLRWTNACCKTRNDLLSFFTLCVHV